jgi:hypothetical protein
LEKFIFFKKLDTVLNKWQIFLGSCAPMEWAYIQRGIGQSIDIRTDRMETVLQIDDNWNNREMCSVFESFGAWIPSQ